MGREVIRTEFGGEGQLLCGRALVVNLDWQLGDDLDMAALCIGKHGAQLIYYGNVGARIGAPFMHLAHSSEGNGRSKYRREHLVITDRCAHHTIHLFVWDHDAALAGRPAEFAENPSSYRVSVTNRSNRQVELAQSVKAGDNCLHAGVIHEETIEPGRASTRLDGVGDHVAAIKRMANFAGEVRV